MSAPVPHYPSQQKNTVITLLLTQNKHSKNNSTMRSDAEKRTEVNSSLNLLLQNDFCSTWNLLSVNKSTHYITCINCKSPRGREDSTGQIPRWLSFTCLWVDLFVVGNIKEQSRQRFFLTVHVSIHVWNKKRNHSSGSSSNWHSIIQATELGNSIIFPHPSFFLSALTIDWLWRSVTAIRLSFNHTLVQWGRRRRERIRNVNTE